jgi:hypothetical protein
MEQTKTVTCPRCGGVAAEANGIDEWFRDTQSLDCGCEGRLLVTCDDRVEVIVNGDDDE